MYGQSILYGNGLDSIGYLKNHASLGEKVHEA